MKYKSLILAIFTTITFSQEKSLKSKDFKNYTKENKESKKKIDGTILKELDFIDINGVKHNLNSLKGKVVLLHFWFIQCKPCVKEFPKLNILKSKFNDKNVEFFAVTWNNKKDLNKFFEKNRLDYNIVPSDIKLKNKFNINIFPSDILIDKEGKVEYINDLLSFEVTKRIERKINKLL